MLLLFNLSLNLNCCIRPPQAAPSTRTAPSTGARLAAALPTSSRESHSPSVPGWHRVAGSKISTSELGAVSGTVLLMM